MHAIGICACGFLSFPSNTRAAAVASAADAASTISRLKRDPSVATATTLASAYFLVSGGTLCDDHNETKFGSTALATLKKLHAKGCVAVAARFFGGVNQGATRFSHVKATVESALKDAGHVVGEDLSEARWRAAGGAGRTTGASKGVLSPDEFRNKRLAMFDRREGVWLGGRPRRRSRSLSCWTPAAKRIELYIFLNEKLRLKSTVDTRETHYPPFIVDVLGQRCECRGVFVGSFSTAITRQDYYYTSLLHHWAASLNSSPRPSPRRHPQLHTTRSHSPWQPPLRTEWNFE